MPPAAHGWSIWDGPAGDLAVHHAPGGPAPGAASSVLVLSHGFPTDIEATRRIPRNQPVLADRLAQQSGWHVLAGCLRGVESSAGDFSLDGWLEDLRYLVERAVALAGGGGVWLAGEGAGGALSVVLGGDDDRVRGVACLAAPATFADWGADLPELAALARRVGLIRTPGEPADLAAWGRPFDELRPLEAAAELSNRPFLAIHGADDGSVPVADARALVDANRAVGGAAELRVLAGAGHRLRSDPRAVALLVGWLERQRP